MDRKLIDAYRFEEELYHEAFERDTDMQRWDSGCWIRYKLFERMLEKQPAVDAIPIDYLRSQVDSGKWEEIITRWKEKNEQKR